MTLPKNLDPDNYTNEELQAIFFKAEYGIKYDPTNEEHTELMAGMVVKGFDW